MNSNIETFQSSLKKIVGRKLRSTNKDIHINGSDSITALAASLGFHDSEIFGKSQNLVILPSRIEAENFVKSVIFFNPDTRCFLLGEYDVSPYSSLFPNSKYIHDRLKWMYHAQNPVAGQIFVTSVKGLMQLTLPKPVLSSNTLLLSEGEEVTSNLFKWLLEVGYSEVPRVEDPGHFAKKGGIIDIFSPAEEFPVRIELFGDQVESIRTFDPNSQRTLDKSVDSLVLIPSREIVLFDKQREKAISQLFKFKDQIESKDSEIESIIESIRASHFFEGIEFFAPYFYEDCPSPIQHFNSKPLVWLLNPIEINRTQDSILQELKIDQSTFDEHKFFPNPDQLFKPWSELKEDLNLEFIYLSKIKIIQGDLETLDLQSSEEEDDQYNTSEITSLFKSNSLQLSDQEKIVKSKLSAWNENGFKLYVSTKTFGQAQRLSNLLNGFGFSSKMVSESDYSWISWMDEFHSSPKIVHIIPRELPESVSLLNEKVVFLREEDFFGKGRVRSQRKTTSEEESQIQSLSFSDLTPGQLVVHSEHGVGVFEGLTKIQVQNNPNEFIHIRYKDNDKLYLPIYRISQIQRFTGSPILDKLGGSSFKTAKIKVRNHLKDIASELLKIYAERATQKREIFIDVDADYDKFENNFPFEETEDQLKAINQVVDDLEKSSPMDRLVCGDVGYGKTEVAMRAAFLAAKATKQVAVLVPTTVLTVQHLESFQKRFKGWPFTIRGLSRFTPKKDINKTLEELKSGHVDIVIGTHRILSKDVEFKRLGLLIVDEEHKFGVSHKEKIRKLKSSVDTISMSATPIPRTLNMSLVGVRDLTLIRTAPVDRLPIRTFICKFEQSTIRKAIESEIHRGGQVFFVHNRVQSIYEMKEQLQEIVPDARILVGHGQMPERELEKTVLSFFNHECDILLSTTIIESGIDIPRANTMIINRADTFGLSQLYQLRGRVGRSKQRAYCYLIVPDREIDKVAQERLRVLQQNTGLGSGIQVAHYDLELRGAGNILGEAQSGHIDAVGYELYLELLEETIKEMKGEKPKATDIEPEMNVSFPALIPDEYISDIRVRLAYYKRMSLIRSHDDADKIEEDLRDQFGKPPESVINLLGIMLIRWYCKQLGIRDLTSSSMGITLAFTERTPMEPKTIIELTQRPNKKYSLKPDGRLTIRMKEVNWVRIHDEVVFLKREAGVH